MHPHLLEFTLGETPFRLPSFGLFLAAGFTTAYLLSLRRAPRFRVAPKDIDGVYVWIVIAAMIGGRLFHVLFEDLSHYRADPAAIFRVWEGGYTFYGSLIAGSIATYWYGRRHGIPALTLLDVAGPGGAAGHAIGRIGCLLAGCCWGSPTNMPWAVTYTHPDAFVPFKNVPLHPTQIYESLGAFLIFLMFRRRAARFPGDVFLPLIATYCVLRFVIEFFRADDYRGYVFADVSTSQFISLLLLPTCLSFWAHFRSRARPA